MQHTMITSTSARHAVSRGANTLGHLASLATLLALLGTSWQRCRETHRRRMAARPKTKPERVQVWEDEGGQNQMPKSPPP